jgi:hypothetical protein
MLRAAVLAALLALAVPGCATRAGVGPPAAEAWVRQELWLGSEIPTGGEVTDEAWEAFVAEEITPRFPGGFSVLEAAGHWRHPDGRAVRERTRVVVVLHEVGDAAAERAVAEIAAAYVARFRQDAALRTSDRVSVRFVEP